MGLRLNGREGKKGIVRDKPEELLVRWMKNQKAICDLCNKEIDSSPFPVIDYPPDEELTNPDYVP